MDNKNLNNIIVNEDMNEIIFKENSNYKIKDKKEKKRKIKINSGCTVNIIELNCVFNKTSYYLEDNSTLTINKFTSAKESTEEINIYLDGLNSKVVLNLSAISDENMIFKINVFHNNKNTISKTNVHGVTVSNNKMIIENNGHIPNNSKNSDLSQDNKIITFSESESLIKPNLYIDEEEIEASHGAYIGGFDEESIFYLKSRGISEKDSQNLLLKGFLINEQVFDEDTLEEVTKTIDKYWR